MNATDYMKQIGKSRGHFNTAENRVQKLIDNWKELKSKLEQMIIRGKANKNRWNYTETSLCAYATLLIMETGIRVGNEKSAEGYSSINKYSKYYNKVVKTYGVTTLLKEHVVPRPDYIQYKFLGKKQVEQILETTNPVLVKHTLLIHRSVKSPKDLFLGIDYYTLQKFIKRYIGKNFKPKDLRQAYVNRLFCSVATMYDLKDCDVYPKAQMNKTLRNHIVQTAEVVGHTPAVCKSSYISKQLMQFHKNRLLQLYESYK